MNIIKSQPIAVLADYPNFTGCVEEDGGDRYWYKNGAFHNENGPALIVNGNTSWCLEGKYYRTVEAWQADVLNYKMKRIVNESN